MGCLISKFINLGYMKIVVFGILFIYYDVQFTTCNCPCRFQSFSRQVYYV